MEMVTHFDVSAIASLICISVGVALLLTMRLLKKFRLHIYLAKDALILIAFVFVTAIVGFVIGFIGPIIFMPSANQGPLIGIFFTGPIGAILGLIAYLVYLVYRIRTSNQLLQSDAAKLRR